MQEPPVRIGMMLYTLIEPHPGRHRDYNRWYERDHFYSGVLTLPGSLSGQRWVATPALKALRRPGGLADRARPATEGRSSPRTTSTPSGSRSGTPPRRTPSAGSPQHGRLWPERDHVLTRFVDYAAAVYRDDDPVPAVQTLDHRYPGLVTVVGRGRGDVARAPRCWPTCGDALFPDLVAGSPFASVLTFTMRPFGGRAPGRPAGGPGSRVALPPAVVRRGRSPRRGAADTFVAVAAAFAADPSWSWSGWAGFVPTVPGTDTHVDLLEAAEAGQALAAPSTPARWSRSTSAGSGRAIRASRELFADDARLVGLGTMTEGRTAIDAFYAEINATAAPVPTPRGPLLVEGEPGRRRDRDQHRRRRPASTSSISSRCRTGASRR